MTKKNFEGYLTAYIPTGTQQIEDIEDILLQDRSRHDFFTLFNLDNNSEELNFSSKNLDGHYAFDSYQEGFSEKKAQGLKTRILRDEYPFYTGEEGGTKHFFMVFYSIYGLGIFYGTSFYAQYHLR